MKNIKEIVDQYEELSSEIAERWKDIIGFGCGYFNRFTIDGDNVLVYYEYPSRMGGGICSEPDVIPIECFKCKTVEEAKRIYKGEKIT